MLRFDFSRECEVSKMSTCLYDYNTSTNAIVADTIQNAKKQRYIFIAENDAKLYFFRTSSKMIHFRVYTIEQRTDLNMIECRCTYFYTLIPYFQLSYRKEHFILLDYFDRAQHPEYENIWKLIQEQNAIVRYYIDRTVHEETCRHKLYLYDLKHSLHCQLCGAFIDIELCQNLTSEIIDRIDLVWKLWTIADLNMYIQWAPEEVLEDIISYIFTY